jgi:hypothetical protein
MGLQLEERIMPRATGGIRALVPITTQVQMRYEKKLVIYLMAYPWFSYSFLICSVVRF